MKKELRVGTKMGTLVAKVVPSSDYPGIEIVLERPDGAVYSFALAEVKQSEYENPPELALHNWSPAGANSGDPIYDSYYTGTEIDSGLKEG